MLLLLNNSSNGFRDCAMEMSIVLRMSCFAKVYSANCRSHHVRPLAIAVRGAPSRLIAEIALQAEARSHSAAIAASLATVFMLRAVPSLAAGMRSLERPIPSG